MKPVICSAKVKEKGKSIFWKVIYFSFIKILQCITTQEHTP